MTSEPEPRHAQLWNAARAALDFMRALHGGPALIACLQWLIGERRLELLSWLRPIEALLRRLIFLDAQDLAPRPAPMKAPRPRARRLITLDPQKPETWPAHFRVLDRQRPRRHGAAHASRNPFSGLYNSFALAERWEAALRVVENPARYARRLAARLGSEPARARHFAAPPPNAPQASPCAWALDAAFEQILWLAPAPEPPDST